VLPNYGLVESGLADFVMELGNWRPVEHAVDSGSVSTNASVSWQGSCESLIILICKRDWRTLSVYFFGNTNSMDSTIDVSLMIVMSMRDLRLKIS
jgi:hypothetical protein